MVYNLFSSKQLPKPMLTYCQMNPQEQLSSENWIKIQTFLFKKIHLRLSCKMAYHQVSNIRRTLVGNKIVKHSDVIGASPVSAAPTTSSFST